eukprot:918931-Pyramimonas_sp.AAC.1
MLNERCGWRLGGSDIVHQTCDWRNSENDMLNEKSGDWATAAFSIGHVTSATAKTTCSMKNV